MSHALSLRSVSAVDFYFDLTCSTPSLFEFLVFLKDGIFKIYDRIFAVSVSRQPELRTRSSSRREA